MQRRFIQKNAWEYVFKAVEEMAMSVLAVPMNNILPCSHHIHGYDYKLMGAKE